MSSPRRLTAVVVGLLATGLSLTACGGSDSKDSKADKPADSAAPAAEQKGDRQIKDATGAMVTVPANPKRVVTLTQEDLDSALSLGVKPVGITNGQGQTVPPKYLEKDIAGLQVVGDLLRPVMDKVVAAQPDLILAGDMQDAAVLAQLKKITPAVVVTMAPTDDWKLAFKGVANALNKMDNANTVLADYDKKVAEAKAKLGDKGASKISIVRWNPQGPSWMEKGQFASTVATDLGLQRPAGQQKDGTAHSAPVSLEALKEIDGDWLFVSSLTPDGAKALADIKKNPAFQQLEAAKANHVSDVDGTVWSTRGAPKAAVKVVEDITKALSGS
jgi:iron complex transport system substrate-binding protein